MPGLRRPSALTKRFLRSSTPELDSCHGLNQWRVLRRRVLLTLEQLEDRWVPATVTYNGSTVTISNLAIVGGHTNLVVAQQSDGRFTITDSGHFNGTYSTSNIVINGSNAPNNITVNVNSHNLTGNLSINGGISSNTISVDSESGSPGEILGSLSITDGNGNGSDSVGAAVGLMVGGSTQIYGGYGNDTVTLGGGTSPTKFKGNLGLHAISTTQLSNVISALGTGYTLGAGLTIDEQISPTSGATKFASVNVSPNPGTTIPGALQVVDSFGNSTVTLNSATIGSLVTNLGQSGNSVSLTGETVNGSAAITFGNGNNAITINGGTVINSSTKAGGYLKLNMGDGNNTCNLGVAGGSFTVNGNVTITDPATAMNGQTIVFAGTVNAIMGGGVDGNLTVNLGNGNNNFTFQGTIANGGTFSYDAPPAGGHVTTTGNDNVTVDLTNDPLLFVNLNFGYGNATLTWTTSSGPGVDFASGTVTGISGKQGTGAYTLNNSANVNTSGVNYTNFP